jgi:antitoxin (DNA-binding transcriptional repressor) of toxin-antitoxin stability system
MAREITEHELGDDEILRRVERGESFVVTSGDVPVAELVPLRRGRFVGVNTVSTVFRRAAGDVGRFRADLDAVADQDSTPRG